MKNISKLLNNSLNIMIALSLAFMCFLVFGNVVLRYAFNSGITWSEEMSRFLFVWMIFLGSIGALKDKQHLGVEMLVKKLPPTGKKIVYTISNVLILFALWLIFEGSWKMALLNQDSKAPATGLPMIYLYGVGMIMSVAMAIVVLVHLYQAFFQKDAIHELTRLKESEEELLGGIYDQGQSLPGGNRS